MHRWAARLEYYVRQEFHHHTHLLDPKFSRSYSSYFLQAGVATLVLLVVMFIRRLLVQRGDRRRSLLQHHHHLPEPIQPHRQVVGGHLIALLIGSAFSFLLFSGGVQDALAHTQAVRVLGFAAPVGVIILLMAITDTEHPPAGGTAIGMATQVWQPEIFGSIIGALVMLAVLKLVLRQHLHDLI